MILDFDVKFCYNFCLIFFCCNVYCNSFLLFLVSFKYGDLNLNILILYFNFKCLILWFIEGCEVYKFFVVLVKFFVFIILINILYGFMYYFFLILI